LDVKKIQIYVKSAHHKVNSAKNNILNS